MRTPKIWRTNLFSFMFRDREFLTWECSDNLKSSKNRVFTPKRRVCLHVDLSQNIWRENHSINSINAFNFQRISNPYHDKHGLWSLCFVCWNIKQRKSRVSFMVCLGLASPQPFSPSPKLRGDVRIMLVVHKTTKNVFATLVWLPCFISLLCSSSELFVVHSLVGMVNKYSMGKASFFLLHNAPVYRNYFCVSLCT